MNNSDEIDHSTLNWVKDELDETLKQAGQALEQYTENPADMTQLRFCSTYLHQVYGILQMLELYGAGMLAEEMENLTQSLLEDKVSKKEDAYEILMGAMLQLSDYLERIQGGFRDIPILILPLMNDLRAVRGENLLSENSFFSPKINFTDEPFYECEGLAQVDQLAKKARHNYQVSLLSVIRGKDQQKALGNLYKVMDKLYKVASSDKSGLLWWASAALLEAIIEETLSLSTSVKMLLGQIDRQLKTVIEKGESSLIDDVPDELIKNILFYVGRARSEKPLIIEVQERFNLQELVPEESDIDKAREGLSGPTAEMFATVSAATKEDIAEVKENLDIFLRGDLKDKSRIEEIPEALNKVGDTLGMIGLGVPRKIVKEKAQFISSILSGAAEATEQDLFDVAGALLYVESALDSLSVQTPAAKSIQGDFEEYESSLSEDGDSVEYVQRELFDFEYEQVLVLAIKEALVDIGFIKEAVVNFINSKEHELLDELPQIFSRVTGALKMLELFKPSDLLDLAGQYLSQEILFKREIPPTIDIDILADAITSVEYYLEGFVDKTGVRETILDVAIQSVGILGYAYDGVSEASPEDKVDIDAEQKASFTDFSDEELESTSDVDDSFIEIRPDDSEDQREGKLEETREDKTEDQQQEKLEPAPDAQGSDFIDAVAPKKAPKPVENIVAEVMALPPLSAESDPEILEIFLEEVDELYEELSEYVPSFKKDTESKDLQEKIKRVFHTYKGSGRLAGASLMGEFAWAIEQVMNKALDNIIMIDENVVEVIDLAFGALPALIGQLKGEDLTPEKLPYLLWKADILKTPSRHPELAKGFDESILNDVEVQEEEKAEAIAEDSIEVVVVEEESIATGADAETESLVKTETSVSENLEQDSDGFIEIPTSKEESEKGSEETLEEETLEEETLEEEAIELETVDFELADVGSFEDTDHSDQAIVAEDFTTGDIAEETLEEGALEETLDEGQQEREQEQEQEQEEQQAHDNDDFIDLKPAEGVNQEVVEAELAEKGQAEQQLAEKEQADPKLEEEEAGEQAEIVDKVEIEAKEEVQESEAQKELPGGMDPVLYDIFSKEANEHLDAVEAFLNDKESDDLFISQDVIRALHTLTGSARMAGANEIAEFGTLLDHFARGHLDNQEALSQEDIEKFSSGPKIIREMIKAIADDSIEVDSAEGIMKFLREKISVYDELAKKTSKTPPVSDDIDPDLIEIFLEEADDILNFIETTVQEWENNPQDQHTLAELHRSLHTLKGGARLSGFLGIGTLSHILETVSGKISEGIVEADEKCFDVIHNAFDRLADMIEQARHGIAAEASDDLIKSIEALLIQKKPTALSGDVDQIEISSSDSPDISEEQDEELVEVFLEEGDEIISSSNEVLQKWIEEPDSTELIIEMQRALHTLKGGARMAGFWTIGNLGHAFETLLIDVLDGKIETTSELFDILETVQDRLHDMLSLAKKGKKIEEAEDLLNLLGSVRKGEKADIAAVEKAAIEKSSTDISQDKVEQTKEKKAETAKPEGTDQHEGVVQHEMVRVRADLLDDLVNFAGEVSIYRARTEQQVSEFRTNLEEMDQTLARLREQLRKMEIETEAQILFRYERENDLGDKEEFDPLELDRFSQIQQLSRSLSESLNDLNSISGFLDHLARDSETLLLQQSRVNSELQEGLMRTRMVPFSNMVPRMRRVIRQTCNELGKHAQLKVIGAQGEMDRNVLDRIIAPLEHMLRNSIAHGIESPKERAACLKNETGNISISLSREGPDIVIRVADDGGGLNHDAIRNKAISLGWIEKDSQLSDAEIAQFILETGFSTAEAVTQIAGRGVGMDVVNNEIKQLGGSLSILSEKGQGTEFTIRLPFTLAVNHALLVNVSDDAFAIPLTAIDGVVRMSHEQLEKFFSQGDEATYEYAGQFYHVVNAASLLGVGSPVLPGAGKRTPVVLVQAGDHKLALHVDGLMGSREIVVKAVGPQVGSVPGIMGATILGNGSVVLILDIGALIRINVSGQIEAPEADNSKRSTVSRFVAMVVDDSITVRKVTSRLLERNGFEVVIAKDGVDAITTLQEQVPDIMLLDVEMPRMDGFELATHMKNDDRLKNIPIIMITSRTGEKHRDRASRIGVDHYMGKPYQENDLLMKIIKLLGIGEYGS